MSEQALTAESIQIDEVNHLKGEKKSRRAREYEERSRRLTERSRESADARVWVPFQRLAIIVGAMKAGTTTLYYYLRQHPEIAENLRTKEPNFFSRHRKPDAVDPFERGWPSYLAQWDYDPAHHRCALEASTSYTKYPVFEKSFERMATMPLDYRFIYILRDPIDRIESQIKHGVARGRSRLGEHDVLAESLLGPSRYASQIDHILEYFDRDRLLLLSFGDLREDPGRLLGEIHRFLDLSDHEYGEIIAQNTRSVRIGGEEWELTDEERRHAYEALAPDLERLREEFGFPVENAFPTVARIAGPAARSA